MATQSQNTPKREEEIKEHLKANLPKLIQLTKLDPLTLAHFTAGDVFGEGDIATLDCIGNVHKKNEEFYKLLQAKSNFFEVLVKAMAEGKQTGVMEILNKLDTNGGEAQQEGEGELGNIVIGKGKFSVAAIVTSLNRSPYFNVLFGKWTDIARGLGSSNIEHVRREQRRGELSESDVIHQIIENWVGSEGSPATMQKLINVLQDNQLGGCVEVLRAMGKDKN